ELALFSRARVIMLMGDVAIAALNLISQRQSEGRVIPGGSTYKIRGGAYTCRGMRGFPSPLQAGPSFFIEKSRPRMISKDIRSAMPLAR
ncbi:MAG: uracil-DNA glycosylase, partial [Chloroflexi bacterium]|nr:uracil-DNA glycosylase [Chloroflexota bacterium]